MSENKSVRATLIEMFTRKTPVSKEDNTEVYWNGEDNLYPYDIEAVVSNSPTAKRASTLMAKFIAGAGVVNPQTGLIYKYSELQFVNAKKAYKITDVIRIASQNIAKQNGVFFHVSYGIDENGNVSQNKIDILDYRRCRQAKEDDEMNVGKIFYKDYSQKTTSYGRKKVDFKWYYPYNPDTSVVLTQIKADAKKGDSLEVAIKKYRGQVFYLNLTPEYKYALSKFDAVYNDCDTEYRMGLYTNTQTRSGFLGKVCILTSGLDAEASKDVDKQIGEWLGGEDSGNIWSTHFEAGADLSTVLRIDQLKPQLDDKLFVETDKRMRRNIMGAANNIPEALISAADGALFGTNADTYQQMKLFYAEQVEEEQEKLAETLTYLGFPVVIEPIAKVIPTITPTEDVPE